MIFGRGTFLDFQLELVRRHGNLAAGSELNEPYPLDCQNVRIIKLLAWSTRDLAALNHVSPFQLTHHIFPTARGTGKRESFVVKGEHGSSGTMITLPWLMTFLLLLHDVERLAFATRPGRTPGPGLVYALRGLRIFMEEDAELAQLPDDVLADRLPGLQPLHPAALQQFAEHNSTDKLWSVGADAFISGFLRGGRWVPAVHEELKALFGPSGGSQEDFVALIRRSEAAYARAASLSNVIVSLPRGPFTSTDVSAAQAYFEVYLAAQGRRTGVAMRRTNRSLAKLSSPSIFEPVARLQLF
ncbi:uncharacterized protein JCM10292_002156 [Rhodotorula paludigena]|uniref:uncharacterized protein n=1 Tax=Rhodotorula paludigena TaxID=86838 RepID=UPI00316B964B